MQNFNRPYQSKNISEFWKRWHISLSTWFRDYLYFSLGGNRVSVPRWYFNLFFVFLVSGFWHGAHWTFVCWGALHGFYLIFALVTNKPREKLVELVGVKKIPGLYNFIQVFTTFCLVAFAWIFFRANSVRESFFIIKKIPHAIVDLFRMVLGQKNLVGQMPVGTGVLGLSFLLIIFLESVHYIQRKHDLIKEFKQYPIYFRWAIYYCGVLAVIFLGVYEKRQFIYFQF